MAQRSRRDRWPKARRDERETSRDYGQSDSSRDGHVGISDKSDKHETRYYYRDDGRDSDGRREKRDHGKYQDKSNDSKHSQCCASYLLHIERAKSDDFLLRCSRLETEKEHVVAENASLRKQVTALQKLDNNRLTLTLKNWRTGEVDVIGVDDGSKLFEEVLDHYCAKHQLRRETTDFYSHDYSWIEPDLTCREALGAVPVLVTTDGEIPNEPPDYHFVFLTVNRRPFPGHSIIELEPGRRPTKGEIYKIAASRYPDAERFLLVNGNGKFPLKEGDDELVPKDWHCYIIVFPKQQGCKRKAGEEAAGKLLGEPSASAASVSTIRCSQCGLIQVQPVAPPWPPRT